MGANPRRPVTRSCSEEVGSRRVKGRAVSFCWLLTRSLRASSGASTGAAGVTRRWRRSMTATRRVARKLELIRDRPFSGAGAKKPRNGPAHSGTSHVEQDVVHIEYTSVRKECLHRFHQRDKEHQPSQGASRRAVPQHSGEESDWNEQQDVSDRLTPGVLPTSPKRRDELDDRHQVRRNKV